MSRRGEREVAAFPSFDLIWFAEKIRIVSGRAQLSPSLCLSLQEAGDHSGIPLPDLTVKSLELGGPNLPVKTLCTAQRRIPAPGVAYSDLLETLTR